ncbi:MAG TPA: energy-coupling factor transporter ATPase [Candidatus Xenobia bacterium]
MNRLLEFDHVTCQMHDRLLLDDVTFSIPGGQWVAIVGRNGSGKTTLARHANALLVPTQGEVRVNGMSTADAHLRFDIRRTVGLVFQNPDHQMVGSVVEEDVAFGPENFGLSPAEVRERVARALLTTGLAGLSRRPAHALSGGQKQRLAIAGLLALEPACMVLDEPTSMLDPEGREEVMAALRTLHREHSMAIVMITHAMEEVVQAERVLVMSRGRVAFDGPPADLFGDEVRLAALGLEPPAAVQVAAALRQQGFFPPAEALTAEALYHWLQGRKMEVSP